MHDPEITDFYQVVTVTEPYGEGDERVEPGIYVVGGEYADNDCTEVWVHVDFALDTDGNDATQYVAERIAAALREDQRLTSAEIQRSTLDRIGIELRGASRTVTEFIEHGWHNTDVVSVKNAQNIIESEISALVNPDRDVVAR